MSAFRVPGATLDYETHGTGPVLVVVPGSSGTGQAFRPLAEHLASHYTVVLYSRRGFSKSTLDADPEDDRRLETDANDVRALIEHVAGGGEQGTVVGISSGAIVALELLTRHPEVTRAVVPYEPPAVKLLPDGQVWIEFFDSLYDTFRKRGIPAAMGTFSTRCFAEEDRQTMMRLRDESEDAELLPNMVFWLKHELRQYPRVELDLDTLKRRPDRIAPAAGKVSEEFPCYAVATALAEVLGKDLAVFPGGHLGAVAHPAEWGRKLLSVLG